MLKPILFLCVWTMLSSSTAWAQSKEKFDPTSVKLDQMQNGITNILTRIFELEKKMGQLNEVEELRLEIGNLKNTISAMQSDNLSSSGESTSKLNDLETKLSGMAKFQEGVKFQIPDLKSRLSDVENILKPIDAARRVVMDDTNKSAKIFTSSSLGVLIEKLPLAENCNEIGDVLAQISRSYNSAFVKTMNGEVNLCTYESERWQVVDSDEFAPGHVITAE